MENEILGLILIGVMLFAIFVGFPHFFHLDLSWLRIRLHWLW